MRNVSAVLGAAWLLACGSTSSSGLVGPDPGDGAAADGNSLEGGPTASGADAAIDSNAPGADASATGDAGRRDSGSGSSSGSSSGGANPICTGTAPGAYCGGDMVTGGDPSTLYQCPGPGQGPTSSQVCPAGCQVESAGTADQCKVATTPGTYKLPWPAGTAMQLTQDCNDSCCNDHVGIDEYAWDFANGGGFPVHASRGGTITHLKIDSTTGCGTSSCENDANYLVIDHGDGSESVYLHLQGGTLGPGVTCGGTVTQGQLLATSGTTGWSTGIHLHFQVNPVHASASTCECGADGTTCAATSVPWASFWPTTAQPTEPIAFVEWPAASSCANRRITMPASQN